MQEGGKAIIEEIMKAYEDDAEIIKHGKSAILSMSALENLSKSAAIAAQAKSKKVVEEKPKDPLAEFRCVPRSVPEPRPRVVAVTVATTRVRAD